MNADERGSESDPRAFAFICGLNAQDLLLFALREFVDAGDVAVGEFLDFVERVALGVFGDGLVFQHLL